jgi:hypothetical protein
MPPNPFVIRFWGGLRDGRTIRSDRTKDALEVAAILAQSDSGTLGRGFDVFVLEAAAHERYQVKSKYRLREEIHLMCRVTKLANNRRQPGPKFANSNQIAVDTGKKLDNAAGGSQIEQ